MVQQKFCFIYCNKFIKVELPPRKIWEADVSSESEVLWGVVIFTLTNVSFPNLSMWKFDLYQLV